MNNQKLDLLQRGVVMKTAQAQKEIPAVSYTYRPDVTEFYKYYDKYSQEVWQHKITLNSVFLKLIAEGIKAAPLLNSSLKIFDKEFNGEIVMHSQINIDVPWLLKNGKIVPITFKNVQAKKIHEIAQKTAQFKGKVAKTDFEYIYHKMLLNKRAEISKDGVQADEIGEGNITVTNIGSICRCPGELTQAMILAPQVATIAIGYAEDTVKLISRRIESKKILPINITFDHRVMNFNDIVPFISKLDEIFKGADDFLISNY